MADTPDEAATGWSVEETQEEDGSWSIVSTALPGLVVGADTREDAWAMWPEVVEMWAGTANDERVECEREAAALAHKRQQGREEAVREIRSRFSQVEYPCHECDNAPELHRILDAIASPSEEPKE